MLEHEDGSARLVSAETLLDEAVPNGRMPPVISLAACYTDVAGEEQGPSFAAQLAQRGACAVIGTRTTVTDRYATLLFARAYGELAAGDQADVVTAVSDARRFVQRDLLAAPDPASAQLASMDEWGGISLLASGAQVSVIDREAPEVAAAPVRTPAWAVLHSRPIGHFVGRRRLQRELPEILNGDDYAGVLLHGVGGIGKTALAGEVLRRTLAHDPAWVVATHFGPLTVDGLLTAVSAAARRELLLRATDAGPQTVALTEAARVDRTWPDRFAMLRAEVLDDLPILVVLDNFEDNLAPPDPDGEAGGWPIVDAGLADLLNTWIASPGRSRFLITTRRPIALPEPLRDRLRVQPVGPLSAAEAGKLIWSLPQVDRHVNTNQALESVWRTVGGHPRSLEYLDAILGHGQARFDDLADRMTRAVRTRLGPDETVIWLAQDRTLDAALADAITLAADDILLTGHLDRLTAQPNAIAVLAAVSVYREPVPLTAIALPTEPPATGPVAEQRWATPPSDIGPALSEVMASGLVHYDPEADSVFMHRWTATELHDRWRARPTDSPSVDDAHRMAASYWTSGRSLSTLGAVADVHRWEEARYHLITAGDPDKAATVSDLLVTRLHEQAAWDREVSLIHDTLNWLPTGSGHRPGFLAQLGLVAHSRGQYETANQYFHQALAAYQHVKDQGGIGRALFELGSVAQSQRRYPTAEDFYGQALTIFESRSDRSGTATALHALGMLAESRGQPERARDYHRDATAIFEELGDHAGVAAGQSQLGLLAQEQGQLDEAERHYRLALAHHEQVGDQVGLSIAVQQLGIIAHKRGDYDEAHRRYHQAIAIDEQLGREAALAIGQHHLGMLAHDRGDHKEGRHRYERSLAINQRVGDQVGIANTQHQLGILAHDLGDLPLARSHLDQALAINEAVGNPSGRALTCFRLGLLAEDLGDREEAQRRHREALTLLEPLGNREAIATIHNRLRLLTAGAGPVPPSRKATRRMVNPPATDDSIQPRTTISGHAVTDPERIGGRFERRPRLMSAAVRLLDGHPLTAPTAAGLPLGDGHGMEELVAVIAPLFVREVSLARWVAIRGALLLLDELAPDHDAWSSLALTMGIQPVLDPATGIFRPVVMQRPSPIQPATQEKIVGLFSSITTRWTQYSSVAQMSVEDVNADPQWRGVGPAVALDYIAWTAAAMLRRGQGSNGVVTAMPEPSALERPGWYVEPVFGKCERYWDGADWTAFVRLQKGRSWRGFEMPLS